MTEPDVTISDYGLFLECTVFAWLLARRPGHGPLRTWICLFFACTGVAALLGGTVHGFFLDDTTLVSRALWKGSLLAIGAAAFAGSAMAAEILAPGRARGIVGVAAALMLVYALVVLFVTDVFSVAVAAYLPAALLLLAAFILGAHSVRTASAARAGVAGLALTFAAAFIQQRRIALHPLYFNHNAFYHVVQAIGLALIFLACRQLVLWKGVAHADTT